MGCFGGSRPPRVSGGGGGGVVKDAVKHIGDKLHAHTLAHGGRGRGGAEGGDDVASVLSGWSLASGATDASRTSKMGKLITRKLSQLFSRKDRGLGGSVDVDTADV